MDSIPTQRGTHPHRTTVATYSTYADAQRAVDYLSDNGFPVERTAIVAEGLRFVEQVTGRLDWGRVLLNGSVSGALTGVLIGLVFGLFSLVVPVLTFVLYGLIVGAISGALLAAIGYGATRGQRDFSSVLNMEAERYNVMVDDEVAAEAEELLAKMGARGV
jgi:hypothetical protein